MRGAVRVFKCMSEAERWVEDNLVRVKKGFKVRAGQTIKWVTIGTVLEGFKITISEGVVIDRIGAPGSISTDYIVKVDGKELKVYRWQIIDVVKKGGARA
jgi:hypothetical protein